MALLDDIPGNLLGIRERIGRAALRSGREPEAITLIAVTKKVDPDRVAEAIRAGATNIGENYVQEAREKIPEVAARLTGNASYVMAKMPTWHLIGHLQSNKAKFAVPLFDLIQSVDSQSLAQEIGRQAVRIGKVQPVLIEVNLDTEAPDRAGVVPEALSDLVSAVNATSGLALNGLMGIAPQNTDAEQSAAESARPHFRRLRSLWESLPVQNRQMLSMGMSSDFEAAIEEGATIVRIGTAIFGRRKV